ncbi:MAG: alanine racemase, partial [Christensenellales bacterium]
MNHKNTIPDTARTWVEIDLAALKSNLGVAKQTGKKVMCVVKANAYGHGAIPVSRFLEANGADALAVSCIEEAIELRDAGISLPLLILGPCPASLAQLLADRRIIQTVTGYEAAAALSREAEQANVVLPVHIKIDTGMSRLGIQCQREQDLPAAALEAQQIAALTNLRSDGIFTHLSSADTPEQKDYTVKQL